MTWRRHQRRCPSNTGRSRNWREERPICWGVPPRDFRGMKSNAGFADFMAARLIVTAETEQDVAEAFAWYESRRPGLDEEFLSCADACVEAICRTPELYSFTHESYRRALVRRFPYAFSSSTPKARLQPTACFMLMLNWAHISATPERWAGSQRERLDFGDFQSHPGRGFGTSEHDEKGNQLTQPHL